MKYAVTLSTCLLLAATTATLLPPNRPPGP